MAAQNTKQEKAINLLKQGLAYINFDAAKKGEATKKLEKSNQLPSELQELEDHQQYLANKCRRKYTVIDRQIKSLKN